MFRLAYPQAEGLIGFGYQVDRPDAARAGSAHSVSAVRIANGEYQPLPPRVVRGSAAQAAIASSVNYSVRLPR
jgi:hypothetical protein